MTHSSGSHTEERDQARAVLAASAGEWQAVPGSAELARVEAMTALACGTCRAARVIHLLSGLPAASSARPTISSRHLRRARAHRGVGPYRAGQLRQSRGAPRASGRRHADRFAVRDQHGGAAGIVDCR